MGNPKSQSESKEDRRATRSKRLIANALRELALEKDYQKITIRDIVERADVGRATFYAHFEDKNDLNRFVVLERFMARVEVKLEASLNELHNQNPTHQNLIPSLALFRVAEENYDLLKKYATASDVGIDSLMQPLINRFEDKLANLNVTETSLEVPLRHVSTYLISALTTLLTQWILDDMPSPPETMDNHYQILAYPTLAHLLDDIQA
ncbi:MAG: TetR/AcrR family transcriptional regulator [Chloroflexota bacterium]